MFQYMTVQQFTWTHPATSLSTGTSRVTSTFQKAINGGKDWETGQCQLFSEIDANQHPLNAAKHESTVPRFGKFRDFFQNSSLLFFFPSSISPFFHPFFLFFPFLKHWPITTTKKKKRKTKKTLYLRQTTFVCGIQNIDCPFLSSSSQDITKSCRNKSRKSTRKQAVMKETRQCAGPQRICGDETLVFNNKTGTHNRSIKSHNLHWKGK